MPVREFSVVNMGLGLNNLISDTLIKDTEASDLLNIEFVESGCPAKRRGTEQVGDTVGTSITGITPYYMADGTRLLIRMNGTTLEKLVDDTWTAITGVTFTAGNANFTQAKNKLYIHNGVDNMAVYDGSTLTQPSTGVKASFGEFFNTYHICGGSSTYPSRIFISNPNNASDFTGMAGTATAGGASTLTDSTKSWGINDFADQTVKIIAGTGAGQSRVVASNTATVLTTATAWTTQPDSTSQYTIATGNTIDIAKDDGDKITGIKRYQDKLIVTKERATYQLTFDSSGLPTVTPIIIGKGCVSYRSMANVENDLYFMGRDGINVLGNEPNYFNVIRTNVLSARVTPEINIITSANLSKCAATYFDNKYILAIPQGGTTYNNTCLVYDKRYTAWSKWDSLNMNSLTVFVDSLNAEHLYYADDNAGKVWEWGVGYSDGGDAINAYWVSKNFDFKDFDQKKRFFWLRMAFRKIYGTCRVEIIVDGDTTVKNINLGTSATSSRGIGTGIIGLFSLGNDGSTGTVATTTSQSQPVELRINKRGRNMKIKISNANIDETFTILEFKGKYKSTKVQLPSGSRY